MFKGLKSLLAGLLAGTALGVLFSPKKGDEIRKDFKKELDEGGTGLKTVKNTILGLKDEIGDSCQEVAETNTFKKGARKAKTVAKKTARKAKNLVNKAKKRISK